MFDIEKRSKMDIKKKIVINENAVITEIRRVYFEHFQNSNMTIINYELYSTISVFTIRRVFGSWNNALQQAEIPAFPKITNRKIINNQERVLQIVTDLNRIKQLNNNQYFTQYFYKQNNGLYNINDIRKRLGFNNWIDLMEKQLGLYKPKKERIIKVKKVYSNEELFDEIKKIWDQLGRRPRYREFKEMATINTSVYTKRFKTWTLSIEKFCLLNKNYTSNNDEIRYNNPKLLLLKELKEIAKTCKKKTLSFDMYKKNGGQYTYRIFRHNFGSWGKALDAVGLIAANKSVTTIESKLLLQEIHRIWKHIGGKPSRNQIKTLSKYPYLYYVNQFGRHTKIITAYMDYLKTKEK